MLCKVYIIRRIHTPLTARPFFVCVLFWVIHINGMQGKDRLKYMKKIVIY